MNINQKYKALIQNTTPAKPIKQVSNVKYTKPPCFNYLIAILALIILAFVSYILVDITGYEIMHLPLKPTSKSKNMTDQQLIQNKDNHNMMLWIINPNWVINQGDDTNNNNEDHGVHNEVFMDENFSTQDEINSIQKPQFENQKGKYKLGINQKLKIIYLNTQL
ncbi:unnamed protein product [Paramecium octaurelia]|uniref:Uncharacterized protein n=1 Tax=Paramecium octaurelia TaxID=43137 RepID=A0A8S1WHH5_PAROT|nr:unnamed protein product [Paramecium octaurelia]